MWDPRARVFGPYSGAISHFVARMLLARAVISPARIVLLTSQGIHCRELRLNFTVSTTGDADRGEASQ
jgi:hypothetical protein